jgi:hypothetical protein
VAKGILLEEFHVSVYAPRGLPPQEDDAMRQTLTDAGFLAALRRAVRRVFRRHPPPDQVRVKLTR